MTLLLHGFMGSGADWEAVREALPADDRLGVLAPDLPGHGRAVGLEPSAYTMDDTADRLAALLDEPAVVAGYSMGGRLALHMALRHPDRVAALVLVSASPGLATGSERADRRRLDGERADAIATDFPHFLDQWYRAPLWGDLNDGLRQRLGTRRVGNDPAELAASLAGMGAGAQPSHWETLVALRPMTWALAGARDLKYVRIAREMARSGRVEPVVVPDVGHALLDQAPAVVAGAILQAAGSNARRVAFPSPPDSHSA